MGDRSVARIAGFALAGGLASFLAWSGHVALVPLSLALPLLCGVSRSRWEWMVAAASYFLVGSRGLIVGSSRFFGDGIATGLVLWLAGSLVFIFVYTMCWRERPLHKGIGFVLATCLLALPPLGITGWLSPLTSAGMILPGTAMVGLLLTLGLCGLLATGRRALVAPTIAAAVLASANMAVLPVQSTSPEGWVGIDTQVDFETGDNNPAAQMQLIDLMSRAVFERDAEVLVFPESALGQVSDPSLALLTGAAFASNKVVIAGGGLREEGSRVNAVFQLGRTSATVEPVYEQRMPVPVSMWRPWSDDSFDATIIGPSVQEVAGTQAAFFICYEQLLVWPYVLSHVEGADHFVGIANDWWADDTTIPDVQKASMQAWARLFGVKLTMSFNT